MRSMLLAASGICLLLVTPPAALAGWEYTESHHYGSDSYNDWGASPASYIDMSISA